jgi:hypothetical protein
MKINKGTLKSKTFWAGLASIVTGAGLVYMGNTSEGVQTIILGVLAIFGRDAIAKIGK